jgi:hypothetical protein
MYTNLSRHLIRSQRLKLHLATLGAVLSIVPMLAAQPVPETEPPTATGPVPKLEVSTKEWDFGEKWTGEPAETTLTLKNVGGAPLRIEKLKTSCGCTAARVENTVLQPGQTEEVKVSYDTRTRKEKVSQTIRVHSNDPDNPVTTIAVTGQVKAPVKITPSQSLQLGSLGREDTVTKSVEIQCLYPEPLELKLEDSQPKYLEVRLDEIQRGKSYKLTATTKPPLRDGSLNAVVRLLTGLERMPTIPVRISGSVQLPVAVTPKVLYASSPAQQSVQRTLRLLSRREHPVAITSITASHPAIKTEILPARADRSPTEVGSATIMIRVTLPPGDELPADGATITIATDDAEFSEFVVPVKTKKVTGKQPRR